MTLGPTALMAQVPSSARIRTLSTNLGLVVHILGWRLGTSHRGRKALKPQLVQPIAWAWRRMIRAGLVTALRGQMVMVA